MAKTDDTQKMLQIIINGQSSFRQEVLPKIDKLDKKFDLKIDTVEKNLATRIDKIGRQLAYLEDDAPTREDFNSLEKRVDKIEQKTYSTS